MLSALAKAIYEILRTLVPDDLADISYSDLVSRLGPMPPPNQDLEAHDVRLDDALGELVHACRAQNLAAIAAMVVFKDDPRVPGAGYYKTAHPQEARNNVLAMIAWARELEAVRKTTYPPML